MPAPIDLAGERFSRLLVLRQAPNRGRERMWTCRCDCGDERDYRASNLRSANSRSCGCYDREASKARMTTHGATVGRQMSKEYKIWAGMKSRCFVRTDTNYKDYGGRGIRVCDRWLGDEKRGDGFELFLADMGKCPDGHTIDRVDVNGHYEAGNCRWATAELQSYNKRNTIKLEIDKEILTVSQAAERYGLKPVMIRDRLWRGDTPKQAVRPSERRG